MVKVCPEEVRKRAVELYRLESEQAQVQRSEYGSGAVPDAELHEHVRDVGIHRPRRQVECVGDLSARVPASERAQDLEFAFGQRLWLWEVAEPVIAFRRKLFGRAWATTGFHLGSTYNSSLDSSSGSWR